MDELKLDQLTNDIAAHLFTFKDAVSKICEPLSNEELAELAQHYRTEAKPTDTHTFAMPIYNEIAETIQGELTFRIVFKAAKEHEDRTGEKVYCVVCAGSCKGHY